MLRSASPVSIAARDPYGMASFPLVPFSNRIGDATFRWQGQSVALKRNYPPELHAIHGVGFERTWRVQDRTDNSAVLSYTHSSDGSWPWAFEARQHIALGERSLILELSVRNLESQPLPLAFGHHPYFPANDASLCFEAQAVWLNDDAGLPSERAAISGGFDLSQPVAVEQLQLDHCYVGWQGPAQISWRNRPLGLEVTASAALSCAVVYARPDREAFCFEPVPHLNNSLNRPGCKPAIPVIDAGEAFEAVIRFHAVTRL